MFGRATIRLGIGPHSSVGSVSNFNVTPWLSLMTVYTLCTPATSAPVERALSTGNSGLFVCPHPGQISNNFLVSWCWPSVTDISPYDYDLSWFSCLGSLEHFNSVSVSSCVSTTILNVFACLMSWYLSLLLANSPSQKKSVSTPTLVSKVSRTYSNNHTAFRKIFCFLACLLCQYCIWK